MRAVVVLDVARPAGRVRTRKTIMYELACAFLSFFLFFALSVLFLPAEEDTCIYMFSPRELGICSVHCFMT